MASGKEAMMMIVDAGSSMDQMYNEHSSRLKISLECISITLQQKIFHSSNHEIGFAIFGDTDTNGPYDDNYLTLQEISKPNLQLLKKIFLMGQAKLDNEKKGGDIFRAIQTSIKIIEEHCHKKKIKKRIFVFTNGMGDTVYNEYTIKSLALQLKACEIKLNIIPINFMEGYVMQQNIVESEISHQEQITNAQLLMDLKSEAEDNVQIFPDSIAIELYKKFRKREVNPVALFRGQLQISPEISIPVETFKMIRRERLKSLAKYDVNQPFNPIIEKGKEISTIISYIIQGDQTNTEIQKANQMNSFNYGPHLVPISDILEKDTKIYEDRNLKLLGFIDKTRFNRSALMGQVESVVPNKQKENMPGKKLFTALIYSMITLNKYAICRYVPRNSKNGVIPRLVVLIPYRGLQRQALYLIDLPTVQDMRSYPFNKLKPSTDSQKEYVKELIRKMQLYRKNDNDQEELLKIENTFNPTRQYFFQTVFYRAVNNDGEIPQLNENIKRYLTPELILYEQNRDLTRKIRKEFKFVRKELAKEKVEKKKQLMWKQLIENQQTGLEDISASSQAGDLKPRKMFDQEQDDENFDENRPLISFNKMLTNNKYDLVDKALSSMNEYILKRSVNLASQPEGTLSHLIQCISAIRRGCDDQQESEYWDNWLTKAQKDLPKMVYNKIIEQGLGFLKKDNKFLYRQKGKESLKALNIKEAQYVDLEME